MTIKVSCDKRLSTRLEVGLYNSQCLQQLHVRKRTLMRADNNYAQRCVPWRDSVSASMCDSAFDFASTTNHKRIQASLHALLMC